MSSAAQLQGLEEIAPCPFCGSSGSRLLVDPDSVQCVECGASGPECDPRGRGFVPPRASVTAWNTRAPPALEFAPCPDCGCSDEGHATPCGRRKLAHSQYTSAVMPELPALLRRQAE